MCHVELLLPNVKTKPFVLHIQNDLDFAHF